jgi:acetyl-CoA acyltransferase
VRDAVIMLTGPIPATAKALAPVRPAWLAETGAEVKAVNPNGGAIALGHPLGGSGSSLMTTMIHRMRDNGIRYSPQTTCEGGGQADATIVELL